MSQNILSRVGFIIVLLICCPHLCHAQDRGAPPQSDSTGVIELRNYIIRPGRRDSFIQYFEENLVASQEALGGFPFARYRVKNYPDNFFWMRGFTDMQTRSKFLPAFYHGPEWKKHRTTANSFLLNNDNVYLLRPMVLNNGSLSPAACIQRSRLVTDKKVAVVDFYISNTKLPLLLKIFAERYLPVLKECGVTDYTLWTSVLQENDFPALPVFQDKNLLVKITFYKSEVEYRSAMKLVNTKTDEALQIDLMDAITLQHSLILYPTARTRGARAK